MASKRSTKKVGKYQLVGKFAGYQARTDKTMLTPNVLVAPSQNMMINTAGRASFVKGYILDGIGSSVIDSGILSNFDFKNFKNDIRNMRAGFLTSAGNDGKLQYRYLDASKTVNWVDLMTALTTVRQAYTQYWDNTELKRLLLWVDGSNNIFEWNGAVTTFASATSNTITKQGTNTWDQEGFYQTRNKIVVIKGVQYTYTGGDATTTLTGVTPDPTGAGIAVGAIVHQAPVTNALSGMTAILATLGPTVIGCGRRNQVYVGSSTSNNLYISKVNTFTDYGFTTPVRVTGEGALIPLDAPPVSFTPQEVRGDTLSYDLFVSQGSDTWSVIRATLSSDLSKETLENIRLKVSPRGGALSNRLVTKMKNQIMFVDNSKIANFLGFMSDQFVPIIVDFSSSIIDDMTSYDFTDASFFYNENYAYLTIPKSGLIRIYNMTDQSQEAKTEEDVSQQPWFWESPITYPIAGLYYTPDKGLCGHSYTTSESYQLFTGGSFNTQKISYNLTMAIDDKGDRTQNKGSDEIYVEGYIKQNTVVTGTITGDLDAFSNSQTVMINGNDNTIVAYGSGGHALGKNHLGSQPLGGANTTMTTLPAWFHAILTYTTIPLYLEQLSFTAQGVDLQCEFLTFGTNAVMTSEGNNNITK